MREFINIIAESENLEEGLGNITLTLSKEEAEVVSEALNHIWRNVMDRRTDGKGAVLRRVLNELNQITDARR